MLSGKVEVEIRDVEVPLHGPQLAAAIVGRCSRPGERALSLRIGAMDAHSLQHELRGDETMRGQTIRLIGQVADLLGGRVAATRLVKRGCHLLTAVVEISTPDGLAELPIEPGQALAISVRLGIPLFADAALFPAADPALERSDSPLSRAVTAFLESLESRDRNDRGD